MRRGTTASALAAVAVCAGLSAGQPPAPKAVDPTDALIRKALASDPDVQVARAKLALAEAEVAKARQAAVARALAVRDAADERRAELQRALDDLTRQQLLRKEGVNDPGTVLAAETKAAAARAALARAETELRLLTGDGPKAAAPRAGADDIAAEIAGLLAQSYPSAAAEALALLNQKAVAKGSSGPIPDRIRAALDVKVRLGSKGDGISLDAAMAVFKKEAGLDVTIRPTPSPMPRIVLDGEELPVGAWFQMFQDHGGHRDGFAFYVREYGLLVANRQTAPPDAMTLTEFWRTRPVVAVQPDPKAPAGNRHEYPHDKLPAAIKVKAGETILVTLPVKSADVEDAKLASDNAAITPRLETLNGKAVVVIQAERAGKARVSWDVTDATGRRFTERGREVEFE